MGHHIVEVVRRINSFGWWVAPVGCWVLDVDDSLPVISNSGEGRLE